MKKYLALALALSFIPTVFAEVPTKDLGSTHQYNGVSWTRSPKLQITDRDLQGEDRKITVRIFVNTLGNIEKTEITRSSGISSLDRKVQRSLLTSKFRPYKENGIAMPFIAEQPFEFKTTESGRLTSYKTEIEECRIVFNSDQWQAQQREGKFAFRYINKPNLDLLPSQLMNQDRSVNVVFKLSKKNQVSDLEIIKSSGLTSVDTEVLRAIQSAKLDAPRKFYQFYKLKFTDHIYFKVDDCKKQ